MQAKQLPSMCADQGLHMRIHGIGYPCVLTRGCTCAFMG